MRVQTTAAATTLVLAIAAKTVRSSPTTVNKNEESGGGRHKSPDFGDEERATCGLYMATSSTSLPDEHKWGVYAGTDIEASAPIGFGDLAIHTFHLMANNLWYDEKTDQIMDDLDTNQLANIVDWFEQFVWVPHSSGGQYEIDDTQYGAKIVTAIPGIGVMGGYNPKLRNADWNHSSAYHREAWNEYPREAHPGRGAYSNYFGLELMSTEVIPAGREIFIDFGENWDDENEEKTKESLTKKDYERVDQTVEKMIEFFDKHDSKLDDISRQKIYEFLREDVMVAAAGSEKGMQIKQMLPDDPMELRKMLKDGGSFSLRAPGAIRPVDWLEKNGLCMDNIKPGPSTIPYAGRGAFANRDIPAGGLVAPVPLIHIPDEKILDMHPIDATETNAEESKEDESIEPEYLWLRSENTTTSIQLLMNYMWGHPESTQLFFPVGAVASYINHAPSKDKINAKMVWSDHPNNHKDWLDEYLEPFNAFGGLVVEIVATRDIKEGEEIFIDYGKEWQEAWEEHVEEWNITKEDSWPIRALDLNQEHKTKPFRTIGEEAYPDNVMVKCFLMVKKPDGSDIEKDSEGRKIRIWSEADSGKTNIVSKNLFDCKIAAHKETSNGHYYDILWDSGKSVTVVKGVPHRAIVFLDQTETGDQHIWNSFRHYISMGDIFPQHWKDLSESSITDNDGYYDGETLDDDAHGGEL